MTSKARWLFSAFTVLTVTAAAAQTPARPYTPPRTAGGQPDLQGVWLSNTATPLERPKALEGRARVTDDEVAEFRRRADRLFRSGNTDFGGRYGAGDLSYYEIVQAPGYVVLTAEAGHEARIIPLDGPPHLPSSIRQMPLRQRNEALFEYACHEGNDHQIAGIVRGAQAAR